MGTNSKIEWTQDTWNPVRGCTRVSPGCGGPGPHGGCYAEAIAARFSDEGQPFHGFAERTASGPRWTGKLALIEEALTLPLRWKKPRRIFVNSMSDLFHERLPDQAIDQVFAVMSLAPQHTFQVLTKRPARMRAYLATRHGHAARERLRQTVHEIMDSITAVDGRAALTLLQRTILRADWPIYGGAEPWFLPNVWLGVSVEDQARADERIPDLLATPAAVRFLSCEPLLGPIDLRGWLPGDSGCEGCDDGDGMGPNRCARTDIPRDEQCPENRSVHRVIEHGPIDSDGCPAGFSVERIAVDLVIVGGESGPKARPMHPDWARSLRDQCAAAEVPFFFKQWGEWREFDHGSPDEEIDNDEERADAIYAAATRPAFITLDGRFIAKRKELPTETPCRLVERVGKKRAGRLLDGVEHNGMPVP